MSVVGELAPRCGGEEEVGRVEEERAEGCEDMMGLPGCTGDTAMERGVGEEVASVGVDGVLLPPFWRREMGGE